MKPGSMFTCWVLVSLSFVTESWANEGQDFDQAGAKLRLLADSVKIHPTGLVESGQLMGDARIDGVPLRGRPEELGFYASGKLRWGMLSAEHEFDGYRLKANRPFEVFEENGLRFGHLASPQRLGGVRLPADTSFYRNTKGRILQAYVPGRARINGIWVGGADKAQQEIQFFKNEPKISAIALGDQRLGKTQIPAGSRVHFDSKGLLRALAPTRQVRIQGIDFEREVQFDKQGRVREGWLAKAQTVGRVPCMAHEQLVLFPKGRIRSCRLHGAQSIQGIRLTADAQVTFHPNGKLAMGFVDGVKSLQGIRLANTRIQRRRCESKTKDPGMCAQGTSFFPSGKLKSAVLAGDQEIGGLAFRGLNHDRDRADTQARIELFANGRVRRGFLSQTQAVDGIELQGCVSGTRCCPIEFHDKGKLGQGCLAKTLERDGFSFRAGTRIRLHKNGRVASGILAAVATPKANPIPPGVLVRLNSQGRPISERLPAGLRLGGVNLPTGSRIHRDPEGEIRAVRLSKDTKLGSVLASSGTFLLFDRWGKIQGLVLVRPERIGSFEFPAYTTLSLDESFVLQQARLPASMRFQGLPCDHLHPVLLHPSGQVARAVVAEPFAYQGRRYAASDAIELYEDGRPVQGQLTRDEQVAGFQLHVGDTIESLFPDGRPKIVRFGSVRELQGLLCRAGTETWFFSDRSLQRCWLATPSQVMGLSIRDEVEFHPGGALRRAYLAREQTLAGIEFAPDAISLYPSGKVRWGRLAKKQTIAGKTYAALTRLRLTRQGEVFEAEPFAPPQQWP